MQCFLYDPHVHTAEVSACGKVAAAEMVARYKQAGYDGIVITDHYFEEYFENLKAASWEDKVDIFLSGYNGALAAGQRVGLQVLLGMELRFSGRNEDFLVYGIDEQFLKEYPRLYEHTVESFCDFIKDKGVLMFQAHPFRNGHKPAPARFLHGVEVFNGNPRHNSHNQLAKEFARQYDLMILGSSDAHQPEDVGGGGSILSRKVFTSQEFANWLRINRYPLIKGFATEKRATS